MTTADHWTITQIAEAAGIPRSTVTGWAQKGRFPTIGSKHHIRPEDAPRIIEMCRISHYGLAGWGRAIDLAKRAKVPVRRILSWGNSGRARRMGTYSFPLFHIGDVDELAAGDAPDPPKRELRKPDPPKRELRKPDPPKRELRITADTKDWRKARADEEKWCAFGGCKGPRVDYIEQIDSTFCATHGAENRKRLGLPAPSEKVKE